MMTTYNTVKVKKRNNKNPILRFFTNTRSNRSVAGNVGLVVFLVLFALLFLFPVIFIVNTAFKPLNEILLFPPTIFVQNPTLDNFYELGFILSSTIVPFTRYIFNTLFIVLLGTVGHIALASMAAFPLAKYEFWGNKFLSTLILYSLMFSTAVTAVPNYVIMSKIFIIDTYWAIILPAFASSLGLYLMKNFMEQIPSALVEAAHIDGANEFQTLWIIVMPVVKPAWITLFILTFQVLWGATGGNFIYTESIKTFSYMLSQITGDPATAIARQGSTSAVSLIMLTIPVTVFIISQSNVLETMSTSGIKE